MLTALHPEEPFCLSQRHRGSTAEDFTREQHPCKIKRAQAKRLTEWAQEHTAIIARHSKRIVHQVNELQEACTLSRTFM